MTKPNRIVNADMVVVFVILSIVKIKVNQNQNQMFNWNKNKEKSTVKLEGCLSPSNVEMCTIPGHGGYPKATCWHCLKQELNKETESFGSSSFGRTINLDEQ